MISQTGGGGGGCHYRLELTTVGDVAVRMRKELARPWVGVREYVTFFGLSFPSYTLSSFQDQRKQLQCMHSYNAIVLLYAHAQTTAVKQNRAVVGQPIRVSPGDHMLPKESEDSGYCYSRAINIFVFSNHRE